MSTDRELLIFAARALGRELVWERDRFSGNGFCRFASCAEKWNPLHDDGDALRLLIALSISISPVQMGGAVSAKTKCGQWLHIPYAHHANDRPKAARAAIVIAAAQAGKKRTAQFFEPSKETLGWL